jgi:malonyl-CoA O-methyltransferase
MPIESSYLLDRHKTRLGFERAADSYDANAVLQQEVGRRLTERLEFIKLQPALVLDLGCGTGQISADLLKRYKSAQVLGIDLAASMVQKTCQRGGWLRKPKGICADVAQLPLKDQCADMALSNLMLQWCNDLPNTFREIARVLKPQGLFMFATLGTDTLKELRASWAKVDGFTHTNQFQDMHDIGDALMQAGFRDPVVDMEVITMTYREVRGLLQDLKGIGANNATQGRNPALTGKARFQALYQAYATYQQADGLYPATYEVIYGHAWAPLIQPSQKPEKFIPIKAI